MEEKKRKRIYTNTIVGLVLLLFPIFANGQEMFPLPKPTHFEAGVPRSKLIVVKEIPLEFNDDGYMAEPRQIAANSQGKIFIYDSKLVRIFMFDKKYEYVGEFLKIGAGPGETKGPMGGPKGIYAGWNEKFYLIDTYGDKIIEFSNKGEYQRDIKVNRIPKSFTPFFCAADKNGYFYTASINDGIVDLMDSQWKLVHTFLSRNLMDNYIYYRPEFEKYYGQLFKGKGDLKEHMARKIWMDPSPKNVACDLTNNNYLFIYLYNSSTVYLFDGKNLVRKFNVLIDTVLPKYKEDINKFFNARKKRDSASIITSYNSLFDYCFLDYDEPYFYLLYKGDKKFMLSQFDLSGKLVRVISFPPYTFVTQLSKRNGLFYAIIENNEGTFPVIYKKVNE